MPSNPTNPKISVILPTFNEEPTLKAVIEGIRTVMGEEVEILVVNDGSTDRTPEIAQEAGAKVISHPYNIGNGAAVKTGIRHAKGDCLILMDGDGQHKPEDIPRLLAEIESYDLVVGARSRTSQKNMPRLLANQAYNLIASYLTGFWVQDLTSGFRAIRKNVARKFLYLLPNQFSYPTTLTLSVIKAGFSLRYIPIEAPARIGKSRLRFFRDGLRFFTIMLKVTTLFSPFKIFFPLSIISFLSGLFYYLYTFLEYHRFTNMSAVLFVNALLIFLMGLISEQIAQSRFDRIDEEGHDQIDH